MNAMAKELGRLAQGYKDTKGTNTIEFMDLNKIASIPTGGLEPRDVGLRRQVVWPNTPDTSS